MGRGEGRALAEQEPSGTDKLRIVCLGDTHGVFPLPEIPDCDLLLIAGDIEDAHIHRHDTSSQKRYLERQIVPWLEEAPARQIIAIAGNHDFLGLRDPDFLRQLPWTYLCDESVDVDGLTIHGSPWTPPFMNWAFMLPEDELAAKWTLIPDGCDILLTHGPPYGLGDRVNNSIGAAARDSHQGSTSLRAVIDTHPTLRLHVFGHIHEGYGRGSLDRSGLPALDWANASRVDDHYRPVNEPTLIELESRKKERRALAAGYAGARRKAR